MVAHTFDPDRADQLEDETRYKWCSFEEFISLVTPDPEATLADFGSGTGFYTNPIARRVEAVYGVDIQPEMHDLYRAKGVPENVTLVTSDVATLPFDDNELDGAFSTMTFHEFATPKALEEVARVIRPGGKMWTVDWAASGRGEGGPSLDDRWYLGDVINALADVGFSIDEGHVRTETFVCTARIIE